MAGRGGNGTLNGGLGQDHVYGGHGDDTLIITDNDTLTGGPGADTFIFENPSAKHPAVIRDFHHSADHLELPSALFGNVGPTGALAAEHFMAGAAATTGAQGVICDQATGSLWVDADGSGPGAAALIAALMPGTVVTASDFLII